MKLNQIILFIFCIILLCIVYNYYKKSNDIIYIENFESILKGLNKNKRNNNSDNNDTKNKKKRNNSDNNNSELKKKLSLLKSKKTGTTFDDLFKAAESMDPDKMSIAVMQKELSRYNDSFKKEKFNNNSKSTAESFEKFEFYKQQFFDIFK